MSTINGHVKIGLCMIGAWPGVSSSKFLFVVIGSLILSLIFQIWNTIEVVHQLNLLMDNLGTTMPVLLSLLKLSMFRLKYR